MPFAHEDLAILTGAFFIMNDVMPIGLVAGSIYGGIVVSDFALYGLGAAARRVPWLERYAVNDRVLGFGERLKRNIFSVVALCRVVPGVVFVAFVACGWTRVSLARFTLASLVVSAVYLPVVLYLAIAFGGALEQHLGWWTWPLLGLGAFAAGLVRQRILPPDSAAAMAAGPSVPLDIADGPSLTGAARTTTPPNAGRMAAAERIPPLVFYAPLALNWIGLGLRYGSLSLPSAANPAIATGGMWGESKSSYFDEIAPAERHWIAPFVVLTRSADPEPDDLARARDLLADAGLRFPLVAKPDIGWQGFGVRRIDDADALRQYLAEFPAGARLILQQFVPFAHEAAVLVAREPGAPRGRVISLTLRFMPFVVGDGEASLRELILRDERARWKAELHLGLDPMHRGLGAAELARVPAAGERVELSFLGNQRAGALYRDVTNRVTQAMHARFDAIASSMREFHYGRFDIRFRTLEELYAGQGFSIVEINGIGGEAIDVWDPALPVGETYRRLFAQQRLIFAIGAHNRARGLQPCGTVDFLAHVVRQTRLVRRYPASG